MKQKLIYIFLLLLITSVTKQIIAQTFSPEEQKQIDSLNAIINNPASHDTSLANAYVGLSEILAVSNLDAVIPLCTKAKNIAEKTLSTHPSTLVTNALRKTLAIALNNIGYVYNKQGDIPKALDYYHKCLKISEEIGDKKGIALSLNNIGFIYKTHGDIPKALEYFHKSLKIREEIGNKKGVAYSLMNIADIYVNQGDIPKALDYYHKSLKIQEEIGDKQGIAYSLNYIGSIYINHGDPSVTSSKKDALRTGIHKALDYYHKSLKIREEIGDKQGIAESLNNIGVIYGKQGDTSVTSSKEDALKAGISKALEYYHKSLKIYEEIGDKQGIAHSLKNIGHINLKQNQLSKALEYAQKSLMLAKELGYPANIGDLAELLYQIYEKQGKGLEALEMYKLHIQMRDSINNESTKKATAQQQAKYEYEKQKAIDDAEHEKQLAIEQEAKAKQKVITYSIALGLVLVVLFLVFVFNRLQVTKKQRDIIEQQKTEVEKQKAVVEVAHILLEEKNAEIIASIRYAKRIQDSLLTSQKYIDRHIERLKNYQNNNNQ